MNVSSVSSATETTYSFSTGNALFDSHPVFSTSSESLIEESVNNYFKSMKEIEAEFLASMNAAKTTLRNMISDLGQFGQNLLGVEGRSSYADPDGIPNGYLEENY